MHSYTEGLLKAAQIDLGYREQSSGYTKFGDWYYTNVDSSDPLFKTAPWCDMFITWAAHQAGIKDQVGHFAYTVDHAKWFQQQGAWTKTPEPGAVVFYDWSGSGTVDGIDHAGIVEKVEGDRIQTIEGNVDGVWLKRKDRDQSKVVGYGLPRKVQAAKTQNMVPVADSNPDKLADLSAPLGKQDPATISQSFVQRAAAQVPVGNLSTAEVAVSGVMIALLCAVVLLKRATGKQVFPLTGINGLYRKWISWHNIDKAEAQDGRQER